MNQTARLSSAQKLTSSGGLVKLKPLMKNMNTTKTPPNNINNKRTNNNNTGTSTNRLKPNPLNNTKWKSPFKTVFSGGPRRKPSNSQADFACYHLSKDEAIYAGNSKLAMKTVPENQMEILRTGKRETYLEKRWDITPASKYYFPEATSWRYGWIPHNNNNVGQQPKKESL